MATTSKSTTPGLSKSTSQALSNIANTASNISAQTSSGNMTAAQRANAISGLEGAISQLQAMKASGAIKSGVDYAELDGSTNASNTDAQIQQARNTAPPVITPESIKAPTPIFPTYQQKTNYNDLVTQAGIQPTTTDVSQKAIEQSKQNQLDLTKQIYDMIGNPRSIEQEMRNSREQQAVEQAKKLENDLAGQLGQITAQGQAAQLSVVGQGRGIPEAIIGGQQAQIARETAIQALPVSAQLQWAQGNTQNAEKTLDRLYQYRSQDIQNEYNYKKELGTRLLDVASTAEKQKLQVVLDAEAQKNKQAQDNLAYSREMQSMALKTGQGNLVSKLASIDPKSATFNNDISKIVGQINDPSIALDREIKMLQRDKLRAEAKAPTLKTINGIESQWDAKAGKWIPAVVSGQETGKLSELQSNVLKSSTDLLDKFDKGKGTAFVGGSRIFPTNSLMTIPGTDVANFEANFNNLKALLSLDNIKLMKGQGQISDGERLTLERASTSLTPSMSEDDFRKVLLEVQNVMLSKTPEGQYLKEINDSINNIGKVTSSSYANSLTSNSTPLVK